MFFYHGSILRSFQLKCFSCPHIRSSPLLFVLLDIFRWNTFFCYSSKPRGSQIRGNYFSLYFATPFELFSSSRINTFLRFNIFSIFVDHLSVHFQFNFLFFSYTNSRGCKLLMSTISCYWIKLHRAGFMRQQFHCCCSLLFCACINAGLQSVGVSCV